MKKPHQHYGLALLFGMFAVMATRLESFAGTGIDLAALFLFGIGTGWHLSRARDRMKDSQRRETNVSA